MTTKKTAPTADNTIVVEEVVVAPVEDAQKETNRYIEMLSAKVKNKRIRMFVTGAAITAVGAVVAIKLLASSNETESTDENVEPTEAASSED